MSGYRIKPAPDAVSKAAEPCVDGVMRSIWRCDCGHLFTEPARGALSELALQTERNDGA